MTPDGPVCAVFRVEHRKRVEGSACGVPAVYEVEALCWDDHELTSVVTGPASALPLVEPRSN